MPMNLFRIKLVYWSLGWIILAACSQEPVPSSAPPVSEVEVVAVTKQTVPMIADFIGQTQAYRVVEIRSQVRGIIQQRFYTEGGDVKKGEPLYQINPLPFRAAKRNAEAQLAQARARLLKAKNDLSRLQPLLEDQAVSQKDVDDAVVEEMAAQATIQAANAALEQAQFDLDNTRIVAPLAGRIQRSQLPEGRLVAAQTDLLTVLEVLDPMYVNFTIPESEELSFNKGVREGSILYPGEDQEKPRLILSDGSIYPAQGKMNFFGLRLQSETGSVEARAEFPNVDRMLITGQLVKVRLNGASRVGVILVPQIAVQQGPQGSFVYVVGNGNKVEVRDITATSWQGDQWSVENGLQEGDQVVVNGVQKIGPGAVVHIVSDPVTNPSVPASVETGPEAAE